MLPIIAPVIFMIAGCKNEGRKIVTDHKHVSAPETGKVTAACQPANEPCCIKVSTIFVEISQENNEELGFDWILEPLGTGSVLPDTSDKTFPTDH
jgi:hypothetical protein